MQAQTLAKNYKCKEITVIKNFLTISSLTHRIITVKSWNVYSFELCWINCFYINDNVLQLHNNYFHTTSF